MRLWHSNRESSNKLLRWRTMYDQEQSNRCNTAGCWLLLEHESLVSRRAHTSAVFSTLVGKINDFFAGQVRSNLWSRR